MDNKTRTALLRVVLYGAAAGVGASLALLTRPPELVVVLDPQSDRHWWMLEGDKLFEYLRQSIACTDELVVRSKDERGRSEVAVVKDRAGLSSLSQALKPTSNVRRFIPPTFAGPYYYLDLKCKHRVRIVLFRDRMAFGPWGDAESPNEWVYGNWWSTVNIDPEFTKQLLGLVKEAGGQQQVPIE